MPAYTDSTTTLPTLQEMRNAAIARRDRAFRGYAVAAPSTGTYAQGDIVFNSAPTASNATMGWVCVTAGTPGTWLDWPGAVAGDYLIGQNDLGTGGDKAIDFSTGFPNKKYNLNANATLTLTGPARKGRYSLLLQTTGLDYTTAWAGDVTLAPQSYFPTYITDHPTLLIMDWRESRWHMHPPVIDTITIDLSLLSGTWSVDCGNIYTQFRGTNSLPTGVTFSTPTNLPVGHSFYIEFPTSQANAPSYSGFAKSTGDASHAGKTRYEVKRTTDTYWLEMLDAM